MRTAGIAVLGVAVTSVALSACSGPTHSHVSSAVVGHFRGLPPGVVLPAGGRHRTESRIVRAAGRTIYVLTWAGGSCPLIPSAVSAVNSHEVDISTSEHDFYAGDDACSADLAATTSRVRVPSGVDVADPLTVRLDGAAHHLAGR